MSTSYKCTRYLKSLPLDARTVDLLSRKVTEGAILGLPELLHRYQVYEDSKTLETIIHKTYFQWTNDLPSHIVEFRKNYGELRDHWPREFHRSLLSMESPKVGSLRHLWNNCNPKVLERMEFSKHRWAREPGSATLTDGQRNAHFRDIFLHYMFLKQSPHLCKNRKAVAAPVVEIPMKPLGHDIAETRIRNLLKRKVAYVWKVLAVDNPPLSLGNEKLLQQIIEDPSPFTGCVTSKRSLQRMYRRACKGAYVVKEPSNSRDLQFEVSALLKRL
ncbi:LADA_0F03268g1_1 [Lachancea dasiensis]|uniref:Genetic interactor of prohibitin 5, mitochondrial n=1 Tax=Lachancea dasiensis TaxID=1072105 RepID=A0A1G4JIN2_9SACH|nr:LADA_0F03268g1_1 [Lachancea dasiensis]